MNGRGQTDIILSNLDRAFYKVYQPKSLLTIEASFRNPKITNWFRLHLSSRLRFMRSGGWGFGLAPVSPGLPQCTISFLFFINDICCGTSVPIKLFADCPVFYNKTKTAQDQINL